MRCPARGLATLLMVATTGFFLATPEVFAQDDPQQTSGPPLGRPGTAADIAAHQADAFESDRSMRVITAEEIWRSNARNLPDLLRQEFGAWMTFANYAGGSPVLGGLAGNDILILLDGIKINNTAYRVGDLEYLSTIDLHMLERIEVVRGAGGRYAGDTAGPVIRLYSKRTAAPLAPGTETIDDPVARAFYRYSSVDKTSIAHVEAHRESERWAVMFGLTTRDIGDLKGGGTVGFQRVTGYEETAGNVLVQYFLSDTQEFDLSGQIVEQQNTSQWNRVEDGSHIVFDLDPRKRELFAISYRDNTDRVWSDRLVATFYQHQQRQRALQQTTATPEIRSQTSDNDDILGLQAHVEVALGSRHRLSYGLELTDETVTAVRRDIDVLTGEELNRGKDPRRDGQSRDQTTIWLEDHVALSEQVEMNVGARYGSFSVSGMQQTPLGTFDLNADDSGVAGYLGIVWSPLDSLRLFANYDRGFRLPGIDEATSHTTDPGTVSLPAIDLVAQTGDLYEIGSRYRNDWIEVSAALFHKELDKRPLLLPSNPGVLPPDPGNPIFVQTASVGEAEIDGIDLALEVFLPFALTLQASYLAAEGDDPRLTSPLAGIPPEFGTLGLRWQGGWRWQPWAEFRYNWAGSKDRLALAESLDPALDPITLESWDIQTLRAGITLPPRLRLVFSLENPTDEAYKPFGSLLYSPGRNLALTAEYIF